MRNLNYSLDLTSPRLLIVSAVFACMMGVLGNSGDAQASDTYYRWKDAQGKLVVSDRPPESEQVEYEVVSQKSSLIRRVQPGEGAVPKEVTPRPGNEFDQVDVQRESSSVVEKNPESCSRAKTNLMTLDTAARIRIRDPATGELRYLSEDELLTQRKRAEDTIRVHCN
ncbi:DUF4124 domain-containing protein [Congregibacter variabilis]|uniref:DUF4124 domain-containing protein n=1 Tax=Congregibacter variabilis TaxID=3081200 RepID=A0ABZ0I3W7_9GAMM|nr:DUF4124 domain-containing protein [Congregibacter sp. IMCC43200]